MLRMDMALEREYALDIFSNLMVSRRSGAPLPRPAFVHPEHSIPEKQTKARRGSLLHSLQKPSEGIPDGAVSSGMEDDAASSLGDGNPWLGPGFRIPLMAPLPGQGGLNLPSFGGCSLPMASCRVGLVYHLAGEHRAAKGRLPCSGAEQSRAEDITASPLAPFQGTPPQPGPAQPLAPTFSQRKQPSYAFQGFDLPRSVTVEMRALLVDWLVQVHVSVGLGMA